MLAKKPEGEQISAMPSDFRGVTARHYAQHRRDVPDAVVRQLVEHFRLRAGDRVLDLGAGTGQLILPLARVVGAGIAMDPEPDMLSELRRRTAKEGVPVLCLLAGDADLGAVANLFGDGTFDLLATANALHWMDAELVFAHARQLLRPGGGLAVVTHGTPLWLGDTPWARALRDYLQEWFGQTLTSTCGTDNGALQQRETSLLAAGFVNVRVIRHEYQVEWAAHDVIGHLYSAMSPTDIEEQRRPEFERGLRAVLDRHPVLREEVPVNSLVATNP